MSPAFTAQLSALAAFEFWTLILGASVFVSGAFGAWLTDIRLAQFGQTPVRLTDELQEVERALRTRTQLTLWACAGLVAALAVLISAHAVQQRELLVVLGGLALVLAGNGLDFVAGLRLSIARAILPGDTLEVGEHSGRVHRLGWVALIIRDQDGDEVNISYRHLIRFPYVRRPQLQADRPVEVRLRLARGADSQSARRLAVVCAAASPYASLHRRPETFLEAIGERELSLIVRGYVFDAAYADVYRTHIVEAWLEAEEDGVE